MITTIFLIDNDDDDDYYCYAARCLSKHFYLVLFLSPKSPKMYRVGVKPHYTHTYSVLFFTGLLIFKTEEQPQRLGQAENEIFTHTSRSFLP